MYEFVVKTSANEELIDITTDIHNAVSKLKINNGICTVFTPHTTAAITINENADPNVVSDILYGLKKTIPQTGYMHSEGNSAAHIKSSIIGCSQQIIVKNNKLLLGTWQGVYFCEFDGPRTRKVFVY